ncbi:MAG: hypothetical protein HFG80_11820 [Eubacterium sp.]|nr:hypothetical protein [Eubacterium sp.]
MKINQKLEGKKVRLIDTDEEVFEAKVTDYIYPEDNEPEGIASIIIWDKLKRRSVEFLETDIKSIEILP